jgi:N-acetylmuramoyl-L-alanine amidase
MQNNSMKEGLRLSEILLDDLKDVNRVKYQSYRQANFAVLRAPDIVSVLVEMAYITNKEDERLLNQPEFQDRMAKTVGSSILKYFKDSL